MGVQLGVNWVQPGVNWVQLGVNWVQSLAERRFREGGRSARLNEGCSARLNWVQCGLNGMQHLTECG